jgi:transposase
MDTTHPAQKRYPPELKERAVRMVQETIAREGESFGVITRIARQLGIGSESLRNWVRQADADRIPKGARVLPTDVQHELAELRRENAELRRANAILKEASVLFAKELDPIRRR